MDLMSERGAFFDLTSSRSVAYDTVISTSDRVEIPVDAPLAMPVQPLAFWQGDAKPAATAKENLVLRRWGVFVATAIMGFAGWKATYDTIASGKYPASRSLFIYVKKAHVGVIPGMKEFLAEYVATKAIGEDGYLIDKGLIAMPKADIEKSAKIAADLTPMVIPEK